MIRTPWKSRWALPGVAIACIGALAFVAVPAGADYVSPYVGGFEAISNNSGVSATLAGQFSVEVGLDTDDTVYFTFFNDGTISSVITDIYWDWNPPVLLDLSTFTVGSDQVGNPLAWDTSASPADLPGGDTVDPDFVATASADSNPPPVANGISNGTSPAGSGTFYMEFLNFVDDGDNDIATNTFWDSLLAQLQSGDLRFGLHVQSIGANEQSDAFYTPGGNVAPVPPAAAIGLLGMGILGVVRARKRRTA